MKLIKKITGILNLVLFTGSLAFATIATIQVKSEKGLALAGTNFVSKNTSLPCGSSQQISEKNETESEIDMETISSSFCFDLSTFYLQQTPSQTITDPQPFLKTGPSIYLEICNFRI